MLDLYKLQVFLAVTEAGSFSGAAERLLMTQSAVSQHIKDLEAGLGRQLFERGWRGVVLTPPGEVLERYARDLLGLMAEAERALTDVQQVKTGRVSIGATPGIAVYLAPEWVQRFRSRYPQLSVALQTGITAQVVADVLAHRVEIGFIEGELDAFSQPQLASLELERVEQVVVVGFKHPWWERDSVPISALHRQSFIVRPPDSQSRIWLEKSLREHRVEPIIGAEFDHLEAIKRTVSAGQCLAILPRYIIQDEVEQRLLHPVAVEGGVLTRTHKVIWDRTQHFSPIATAFLADLIQDYPALRSLAEPSR